MSGGDPVLRIATWCWAGTLLGLIVWIVRNWYELVATPIN